jgi:hypothetical protein
VPEASVDEDGELDGGEGDVDGDWASTVYANGEVDSVSQPCSM